MNETPMKLRPVDFSLLNELAQGRNVAANLHIILDVSRQYVNERMGLLNDYDLVKKVGPNENVGLYEITEKGLATLELSEYYGEVEDFDTLLEEYLEGDLDVGQIEDNSD